MTEQTATEVGHGKVILLGEHSVVYGRPAIAGGLKNGAKARASRAENGTESVLRVPQWNVAHTRSGDDSLARAFDALLRAAHIDEPLVVDASVELPSGGGLGSSAALAVAVLRAIDALTQTTRSESDALEVSLAWERVFHGNPSGVDNALAYAGGLAYFVRGEPLERIHPKRPVPLVIANSGEACSTKTTVAEVARQYERKRDHMEKQFDAIAAIVRNGRLALESGDLKALGQLFDMNQSILAGMLISTSTLEEMIAVARTAGALGAKLTGGGGGGCMIALAQDASDATRIAQEITRQTNKEAFVSILESSR